MKTLADRVSAALKHAGLSQADLARACKISAVSVNNWMSGETRSLKAATAIAAAKALGVSADWLSSGTGEMVETSQLSPPNDCTYVTPTQHTANADPAPTITGRHQKLIALFEALTPERQDQLIRDLQNAQQADEEAAERLSADRLEAILKRKKSRRAVETRQFAPTAPIAVNPDIPALESP